MTRRRLALGREGEAEAARYMETRGYRIVARNVRAARVEIDLIAQRGPVLVFVEVKSRRASGPDGFGGHGRAAEAVDARKQARLRRGARAWLDANLRERARARHVRFDVITCLLEPHVSGEQTAQRARALARLSSKSGPKSDPESDPRNDDTAPKEARWSVEHWEAAF